MNKRAALVKEAEAQGISYEELKQRQKNKSKKKREASALESKEHETEIKRMRAYSKVPPFEEVNEGSTTKTKSNHDNDNDDDETHQPNSKRRRTRSMDAKEEIEVEIQLEKTLTPEEWRKEHTLTLRGHGSFRNSHDFATPYIEFKDTPFSPRILETFQRAGFNRPTPIQAQCWPLAVEGKDLISIAKTGSGKTLGFLLPVFHSFENGSGNKFQRVARPKPILLVLAPTRELSVQILEETQKFGRPIGIRSVCCYGGSSKYPQIAALERGVECIIATPGRLNDLLEMRKVDLSSIKYLVLDEADRMLDMVRRYNCKEKKGL